MARNYYSRGINEFYVPQGRISINDFSLDENGYVKTSDAYELSEYADVPMTSHRWFQLEESLEWFPLHKVSRKNYKRCEYWYIMGRRVAIEYYDTNVLMEIQNPIEESEYKYEDVLKAILQMATKMGLKYNIVGDNSFINITQ